MKTLSLLIVTILTSAQVLANNTFRSPIRSVAEIISFNFDKNSNLNEYHFDDGALIFEEKNITVHFAQRAENCPKNTLCPAFTPIILDYKAVIIDQSLECGSKVYRAILDDSSVDGSRTEIKIVDHATRTCKDNKEFITEINVKQSFYDRINNREVIYNHFFGANLIKTLR